MVEVMQRSYDVIIFILKYLYLRRSVVADFDNIAKITTMLIKATFKDLIKVKWIRKKHTKMEFLFVFPNITNITNFQ